MAKRNVEKITIDGTDYALMQFSDFSYIPNRYDATRYQMELANGIYYPSGVSVQGNTMNDIIPQGIGSSSANVSKPIDNYNAILLKQVPANQGNANFFSFYNSSNELLFEEGYLMTNYEANTLVNFAIIIDDDGFADVIGVLHYYNGSVTATRIDHYGGNGEIGQKIYAVFAQEVSQSYTSNGGGATHIAKRTGQLKDLSSYTSDILMVSGGGGGGLLVAETEYTGKEAGGISGSGDNSGNQSTGNAFGLGESGTNVSGGGSGLYGGYKGTSSKSGGAGSGYIGNSLLSNKKMVGYNVPTSSAEGTKTESVNEISASAVSGKPKSGNGFAKIKLLNESKNVTYKSIAKTSDITHYATGGDGSNGNIQSAFSSYKNTDYILWSAISSSVYSRERPFDYDNSTGVFSFNSTNYTASGFYGYVLFPFIPKSKILKVSFKIRIQSNSSVDFGVRLRDADLNSSTMLTMFLADPATQMDWTTVEYSVPDAYRNTEYGWLQMHFQVNAEVKDIVFTYLE